MLLPPGVVTKGATMASPTQYDEGVKVIAGADGTALTINVMVVAALSQPLPLISVTKMVRTIGVAELKPSAALVGLVPVVISWAGTRS